MSAQEKFKIGQRVRMTEKAIAQYLQGTNDRRTGVVTGFPITGYGNTFNLVYVTRDGTYTKSSYHMDFWEPEDGQLQQP